MPSITEENYLKALLKLSDEGSGGEEVGTNELANYLGVKPSSVHDMLKRLRSSSWIDYEKYGKIVLTRQGRRVATDVIRKHRLWETFLHDKLGFSWDEVHEVAEQLEHIQSVKLIDRLDRFLGFPRVDPHGDVIPAADGQLPSIHAIPLSQLKVGLTSNLLAVKGTDPVFLQYLSQLEIKIGLEIKLLNRVEYDGSVTIDYLDHTQILSKMVAEGLFVSPIEKAD